MYIAVFVDGHFFFLFLFVVHNLVACPESGSYFIRNILQSILWCLLRMVGPEFPVFLCKNRQVMFLVEIKRLAIFLVIPGKPTLLAAPIRLFVRLAAVVLTHCVLHKLHLMRNQVGHWPHRILLEEIANRFHGVECLCRVVSAQQSTLSVALKQREMAVEQAQATAQQHSHVDTNRLLLFPSNVEISLLSAIVKLPLQTEERNFETLR